MARDVQAGSAHLPPGTVTAVSIPARLVNNPSALLMRLGAVSAALLGVVMF